MGSSDRLQLLRRVHKISYSKKENNIHVTLNAVFPYLHPLALTSLRVRHLWMVSWCFIYHLQGAKLPASDYIKNCSWKIWNTPNSYPYSTYIDLKSLCALAHAQWQLLCSLIQTGPIVSVSWINNCLNMLIGEKNRKKHFLRNVTNQNLLFNWKVTHASTRKF